MGRDPITYKGKQIIDTGLPQRSIKPIWLNFHTELGLKIADAIVNSTPADRKVVNLIKFDIANMLDEDKRKELFEWIKAEFDSRVKEAKDKNGGKLSNEELARIEQDVHIDAVQGRTDYVDTAFGVSHRLAIGIA